MAETVEAIYEGGVLRPVRPLHGLQEHAHVKLTVEPAEKASHPLAACFGIMPDEDAAEMLRIIEEEFERVEQHEWE